MEMPKYLIPIGLFCYERSSTMKLTPDTVAVELRVKVKLTQGKTFEPLITSFFQNFNPENSLTISGSEADLTLIFTEPPMEIIKAIGTYESIGLSYSGQHSGDNTPECATTCDSPKTSPPTEATEATEVAEYTYDGQVEAQSTDSIRHTRAASIDLAINLPELKEFAEKAESFDDFLLSIEEWLEINKYQQLFESLAEASTQVSKISWKELDNALISNGVTYSHTEKAYLVRKVADKLQSRLVSILPLLSAIAYYYKNFSFKTDSTSNKEETVIAEEPKVAEQVIATNESEPTAETEATEDTISLDETATVDEGITSQALDEPTVVEMECMPEIEEFQEVLSHIDRTQSVDNQIRYVLNAMGLGKHPANVQNQILEIAGIAVKGGISNWDSVFEKSIIPPEESNDVRLTFSSLVNDYIKKYVTGHKVKIVRFLADLKKVIIPD